MDSPFQLCVKQSNSERDAKYILGLLKLGVVLLVKLAEVL